MSQNGEASAVEKLMFLLIGAGIGATVALLFAPKSGRELRGDIADYTKRGLDAAGEGARKASDKAGELYETGRERVSEAYDQTRGKLSEAYGVTREKIQHGADSVSEVATRQRDQITAAIEAGKQAYKEEKRKAEVGRAAVEGDEA